MNLSEELHSAIFSVSFLMNGLAESIKGYLNNDAICNDENATFYSFRMESNTSGMNLIVNGRCFGDRHSCERNLSTIVNEGDETSCNNPSIMERFSDSVTQMASSVYDIQQELNLESLIPKILQEEKFEYEGVFTPEDGDVLDQINSISFGPPQLHVTRMKVMKEHDSLHQSQAFVIRNIFQHFNISFNENATECSYDGVNCDGDDIVVNIWLREYFVRGNMCLKIILIM